MRRLGLAAAVCALGLLTGPARGQTPSSDVTPATMPGQPVGTVLSLNPVGTAINKAVPSRSDLKKLQTPTSRPYDPSNPLGALQGSGLSASQVVAPVAGLGGTQNPNLLQRLYQKTSTQVTDFFTPSKPQRPTYTPGLSRRDRERAQKMWRRD